MRLAPQDVEIFYEIQPALFSFVNQQRRLFPEFTTPDDIRANADMEHFLAFRAALYGDRGLFDEFATSNPSNLPAGHLEIARSWQHFVAGEFHIFRYPSSRRQTERQSHQPQTLLPRDIREQIQNGISVRHQS